MDFNKKQALQNAASYINGIIHEKYEEDKRKKTRYFLTINNISISPVLNFNEINCFILGYIKCLENCKKL